MIAGTAFLYARHDEILTEKAYWFDGFVFVVWVALLISPLFEQINILGVGFKQRNNEKFTANTEDAESKVPAGGQATEQKECEAAASGLKNVAKNKPVSYVSRPIFLTSGSEWDRDHNHLRFSIDQGKYPSNLTDGNRDTLAYPASWFFDFVVDLLRPYDVEKINLVWGYFGKEKDYITQWKLYAQERLPGKDRLYPESEWRIIGFGGFPDAEETPIPFPKKVRARRFRIVAESIDTKKNLLLNWIGMAEFEAYADDKKSDDGKP